MNNSAARALKRKGCAVISFFRNALKRVEKTPKVVKSRKYDYEWTQTNVEVARTILKQGELRLDAQLRVALAADQRAMVSAGICAAFAGVITTATITNFSHYHRFDIAAASGITALILLVAAALFLRCAKPVKFKPVGNEPKYWFEVRNEKNLAALLGGECENYQVWIEENNESMAFAASWYWRAIKLATTAPLLGALTFAAFHLNSSLGFLRL